MYYHQNSMNWIMDDCLFRRIQNIQTWVMDWGRLNYIIIGGELKN